MTTAKSNLALPGVHGGFGVDRCRCLLQCVVLLVALALGSFMSAVAGSEVEGRDDAAVIAERAAARWKALVDGDLAAAYALATPAYRDANPLRLYVSRFGQQLRWTDARVMDVAVDQDIATVRVLVSYVTLDPIGGTVKGERPLREAWVRVDGVWWHSVPK